MIANEYQQGGANFQNCTPNLQQVNNNASNNGIQANMCNYTIQSLDPFLSLLTFDEKIKVMS